MGACCESSENTTTPVADMDLDLTSKKRLFGQKIHDSDEDDDKDLPTKDSHVANEGKYLPKEGFLIFDLALERMRQLVPKIRAIKQ